MAQVVQQRTSPYLTVILAFTTVVFLGVAVLMYVQKNDQAEKVQKLQQQVSGLADSTDLGDENVKALLQQAQRSDQPGTTVLGFMQNRIEQLAGYIDPATSDFAGAVSKYQEFKKAYPDVAAGGLVPAARRHIKLAGDREETIETLREEKNTTLATQAQKVNALQSDNERLVQEKQALQQQVDGLDDKIAAIRTDCANKIEQQSVAHRQEIDNLTQQIAQLRGEIQDTQFTIKTKEGTIDRVTNELSQAKTKIKELETRLRGQNIASSGAQPEEFKSGQSGVSVDMATKPDGRVLRVVDDEALCYINIGREDGLDVDTSFAVFDSQASLTEENVKATLVVTSVRDKISVCRIASKAEDNPIRLGDPVVNVAFDATETYTFHVIGDFDLTGNGTPTPQGQEQIKAMIRESGGEIAGDLGVETDFLVAGPKPGVPPAPREGSDLATRAAYQSALAQQKKYEEDIALAMKLGVQILNTNRFLYFMGVSSPQGAAQ